jgi:hypothetical protein
MHMTNGCTTVGPLWLQFLSAGFDKQLSYELATKRYEGMQGKTTPHGEVAELSSVSKIKLGIFTSCAPWFLINNLDPELIEKMQITKTLAILALGLSISAWAAPIPRSGKLHRLCNPESTHLG